MSCRDRDRDRDRVVVYVRGEVSRSAEPRVVSLLPLRRRRVKDGQLHAPLATVGIPRIGIRRPCPRFRPRRSRGPFRPLVVRSFYRGARGCERPDCELPREGTRFRRELLLLIAADCRLPQ